MDDDVTLDDFDLDDFVPSRREEEALFARGEDDALIRYDKPSLRQFEEQVTILIDGEPIAVPKAKPQTDALGNPRRGPDGNLIPRATTIYDAALALVEKRTLTAEDLCERIPVLCHQRHLDPVGMCRMCSVHISSVKRGRLTPGRKLVPACQHRVEDKMAVITRLGPRDPALFLRRLTVDFGFKADDLPKESSLQDLAKTVGDSTRFLGELLSADHLRPDPERGDRYHDELCLVAGLVGVPESPRISQSSVGVKGRNRKLHPASRSIPLDVVHPYSSRSVHVDHDRCILCDRCVRSCSDVKPFQVIGHTGKGYRTRISFDLDQLMSESSCVQCGECMTACPTGALTLNRRVSPTTWGKNIRIPEDPAAPLPAGFLTAEEMRDDVKLTYEDGGRECEFFPFHDIPYSFLRWNEGAVRRRILRSGDVLCRQGDFGSTAFLLIRGSFRGTQSLDQPGQDGTAGFWSRLRSGPAKSRQIEFGISASRDLITGEIACLTNDRRTATLIATTDAEVLEITRNLLAMLQRSPSAREVLDSVYRRRAITTGLSRSPRFQALSDKQRSALFTELARDAEMVRIEPGGVIVAEGDRVGFDADRKTFRGDFYVIHLGFVKVSRQEAGRERVINRLGKGDHFGEIALLPDHPLVEEAREKWHINPYERTATVTALGEVEVVRIPGRIFRRFFRYEAIEELRDEYSDIADLLAADCVARLTEQHQAVPVEHDRLGDFVDQGLFQGQKMLALDLVRCTRCDECTRACADAHGDGHSRMLREGLRFGDFLVAASCRSCHQPYCMDGCPVDAIHRDAGALEVLIEDHCIGCGLCERNCPYGSIQMVPKDGGRWSELIGDLSEGPRMAAQVARKAVNCDLCHDLVKPGRDPYCVSACPHDAAFRWSGERLMDEVRRREQ